jgi:UDP-glucose 4-epimerase
VERRFGYVATMRSFVVGGAGFIGSHLTDKLVELGPVTLYDNLSTGRTDFVAGHLKSGAATLVQKDALDLKALTESMAHHDVVFHLAANSEAHLGLERTRLDLEQGTIVTYNVLEAMRSTGVGKLVFASSGAVYGDTPEPRAEHDLGNLPVSLHGASKLAGESLVSAFGECFGLRAWIFRIGEIIGPRCTRGAAIDFLKKLRDARTHLDVPGDGNAQKPYLDVSECVLGMLHGMNHAGSASQTTPGGTLRDPSEFERALQSARARVHVLNLTPPDTTSVKTVAQLCVAASPYPKAEIRYTGGDPSRHGDVVQSRLKPDKLAALGFRVRHTSDQAVEMGVRTLAKELFR